MTKESVVHEKLDAIFTDTKLYSEACLPYNALIDYIKECYKKNNKVLSVIMTEDNLLGALVSFLAKIIFKKMDSNLIISSNDIKKLDDLFSKDEVVDLKKRITAYMESFPREYVIDFALCNVRADSELKIKVNKDISFVFKTRPVTHHDLFAWSLDKDRKKAGCTYSLHIMINYKGYITTKSHENPHSFLKQIVFLAISLGFFNYFDIPYGAQTGLVKDPPINESQNSVYMDKEFSVWSELNLAYHELDFLRKLHLKIIDGESIEDRMNLLKIFVNLLYSKNSVVVKRLKSAFEWMYEERITKNETFKYIFMFIALEAIFGEEKSKPSITLKHKCADVLSENHEERKKILRDFPKLYKLRSKLVHGSKSYLTAEDRNKLSKVEEILEKVIKKEMHLLQKEYTNN